MGVWLATAQAVNRGGMWEVRELQSGPVRRAWFGLFPHHRHCLSPCKCGHCTALSWPGSRITITRPDPPPSSGLTWPDLPFRDFCVPYRQWVPLLLLPSNLPLHLMSCRRRAGAYEASSGISSVKTGQAERDSTSTIFPFAFPVFQVIEYAIVSQG